MRLLSTQQFLAIYSGVLTLVFAVTVLGGFAPAKKAAFDEIDVRRINIVEPDGTLRMVIADKAKFPEIIIKGKSYRHPSHRQTAGVLFFNDEGTENGGLTFGGSKDSAGKVHSHGHLSFDEYMQDQVFSIDAADEDGRRQSGISIVDRGDYSILDAIEMLNRIASLSPEEQQSEKARFQATHPADAQRAYFGRSPDNSVGLTLKDPEGRARYAARESGRIGGAAVFECRGKNNRSDTRREPVK